MKEGTPPAGDKSVSLEFHQGELTKKQDRVVALESALETSKQALASSQEQAASLSERVTALEGELASEQSAALEHRGKNQRLEAAVSQLRADARVRDVIGKALETKKIAPVVFKGYDANDIDSAATWMQSRFANFDAFQETVQHMTSGIVKAEGESQKSGHTPGKDDVQESIVAEGEELFDLTPEQRKHLESLGIDPSLAEVTDEDTLRLRIKNKEG